MTHYIIADTMDQGRKAEATYREKNPDAEVRVLTGRTGVRALEGARLFPGDTFVETAVLDCTRQEVINTWDVILRSAHRSKVMIRRRMGKWHAIPNADHPILKVDPLLDAVRNERIAQLRKWGEQHHGFRPHDGHPDFDTGLVYRAKEEHYKRIFEQQHQTPEGATWDVILLEEVYEALAEDDPKKRVEELIQVAAVALAIAEDLEGRDGQV